MGVPGLPSAGEHAGPIRAPVRLRNPGHWWVQWDALGLDLADHPLHQVDTFLQAGHAQSAGGPRGLGPHVPFRERRPPVHQPLADHGGDPGDHVIADLRRSHRPPGIAGQHVGGDLPGCATGYLAGGVGPPGQQLTQRVRGLRGSGRQRGLLSQLHDLRAGRCPAVVGVEPGAQRGQLAGDRRRPGGERGQQVLTHPGDLMGSSPLHPPGPEPPPHRKPGREVISEHVVEHLRHRHRGQEQGPPIQGAPPPVGALDPVGDDHMGMQVRVPVSGVPMVEPGREHPARADLHRPLGAHPGEQGTVLDQPEHGDDRSVMRAGDRAPGLLITQTPEHAG